MRRNQYFPYLLIAVILLAFTAQSHAQNPEHSEARQPPESLAASLPDAPGSQAVNGQAQSSVGADLKSQYEKAEEQVREQERQRVLGVVPAFNTSYRFDAEPLTAGQKMRLAIRSAVDPVTFGTAILVAGYHEANDDYAGFGWGPDGFGKRAGAAYLDSFNGTMIGNGILPALLRQDPRYFRLGHGTPMRRLLYAASTTFVCRGDKSRHWQPNVSNVGGNIIAGALSNLYYPSQDSGWGQTIGDGMIVTVEGTFGGIFQEFWPDISRKLFHRDPTNGLDSVTR